MKNILKIIGILLFCLASECSSTFEFVDDSRLVIEGTLRHSNGTVASDKSVILQSVENIYLADVKSDSNGRFFITSPMANYPIILFVNNNEILSVSQFPEKLKIVSNKKVLTDLTNSYYEFGSIEIKPMN